MKENISLSWFFDYLYENKPNFIKLATMDTIIKDLKNIPDFNKYFQEMSDEDKQVLDELEKRYKRKEFDDAEYHNLADGIKNKYYKVTNMCREFYMFQNFRNQVDSTRYIYCECLMVEERASHKQFTLAVFFDAGTDGNINYNNMVHHEVKEEHINLYCNEMKFPGINLSDASYFAGKEQFFRDFSEMKLYVEKIQNEKRYQTSQEKYKI